MLSEFVLALGVFHKSWSSTTIFGRPQTCPNTDFLKPFFALHMVEITIRKRPRAEAVITQRKFFKKTARGKVIKGLPLADCSVYGF